ncbi:MAG: rhodanese-like domain-containing protein [Bacteroidota bacterium]
MFRQAAQESLLIILASSVLGLSYSAISQKGLFRPKDSSVAIANTAPSVISFEEAKTLYDSKALFVDSRHPYEFKLGHIPGSLNIPLNTFEESRSILAAMPKDKLLVTYCDGVDCNSSMQLAAKLFEAGFTNVKIFFSGWQEWKSHGLPVEQSP